MSCSDMLRCTRCLIVSSLVGLCWTTGCVSDLPSAGTPSSDRDAGWRPEVGAKDAASSDDTAEAEDVEEGDVGGTTASDAAPEVGDRDVLDATADARDLRDTSEPDGRDATVEDGDDAGDGGPPRDVRDTTGDVRDPLEDARETGVDVRETGIGDAREVGLDTRDTAPDVRDTVGDVRETGVDTRDARGDVRDAGDAGDAGDAASPSPFGAGSFVRTLAFKSGCCRDFDGDGSDDNAVYRVGQATPGLDLNQNIQRFIENGRLVILYEFQRRSSTGNKISLDMFVHPGEDTDNNFQDNLNGRGSFNIVSSGSTSTFQSASVQNSRLRARGGRVQLTLPLTSNLNVDVMVEDARVEADVAPVSTPGPGGRIKLTNGEISGKIAKKELFEALNREAQSCRCVRGKLFQETTPDRYACRNPCRRGTPSKAICSRLGCRSVTRILNSNADIDEDGNGVADHYSLGATFTAVRARIVGRTP